MSGPLLAGEALPQVPPELKPLETEARAQFADGNYAAAQAAYQKLLERAPDNVRSISNLGVVFFRLGKFDEAAEQFKKGLTLAPEDGFCHRVLGIVYYAQGKYVEARQSLDRAIKIDPKDAVAYNYRGINASQLGSNATAAEELKMAIAMDGAYGDAYFNLAVVLVIKPKPDLENARAYYERALKLGAEPDKIMEKLLGWVDENGIRTAGQPLTPQDVKRLQAAFLARG